MTITDQCILLKQELNEIQWRHFLGSEALLIGDGGINQIMLKSGADFKTVKRGIDEIQAGIIYQPGDKIRKAGGGRKKLVDTDATLSKDLNSLLEPKGDPMALVQWTTKSLSNIVKAMSSMGHNIKQTALYNFLKSQKFSLKANKKNIEGVSHPDRDEQFKHINEICKQFEKQNNPIISVDCKKKELIGNFKNSGKEWEEKGANTAVSAYDFASLGDGKAVPYGIYDLIHNKGFVNVGIDHDTAEFSVESIRRWWNAIGKGLYPKAKEILITADGGGSNGVRNKLWKRELQKLSTETKLEINVCHYPPATSKWNKIEHRLFSFISINWRAKPLTSLETVIELISHTTTEKGLTVAAVKDSNIYPIGKKVTDEELATFNIIKNPFHGEWNYIVKPQHTGSYL
jgi:transposase